jgi:hypothetical protein
VNPRSSVQAIEHPHQRFILFRPRSVDHDQEGRVGLIVGDPTPEKAAEIIGIGGGDGPTDLVNPDQLPAARWRLSRSIHEARAS